MLANCNGLKDLDNSNLFYGLNSFQMKPFTGLMKSNRSMGLSEHIFEFNDAETQLRHRNHNSNIYFQQYPNSDVIYSNISKLLIIK